MYFDLSAINAPAVFVSALVTLRKRVAHPALGVALRIGDKTKLEWLDQRLRARGYHTQMSTGEQDTLLVSTVGS